MTHQLPLYRNPPDIQHILRGETFLAFTGDTREEEAAAIYRSRYGRDPEYLFDAPGRAPQLWLGPIPKNA